MLRAGADASVKGNAFDETGCEAAASQKFDAAASKLSGCPACLTASLPTLAGDTARVFGQLNAQVYCASHQAGRFSEGYCQQSGFRERTRAAHLGHIGFVIEVPAATIQSSAPAPAVVADRATGRAAAGLPVPILGARG